MNSNYFTIEFIFRILVIIIILFYLNIFYRKNKKIINEIKYGKILFFITGLLILLSGLLIFLKQIGNYFYLLIPLLPFTIWFSYNLHLQKKSKQNYVYLITMLGFCIYIFYELFKTNKMA